MPARGRYTYPWFQVRWNKCFSWRGRGESYLLPLRKVTEYSEGGSEGEERGRERIGEIRGG